MARPASLTITHSAHLATGIDRFGEVVSKKMDKERSEIFKAIKQRMEDQTDKLAVGK